MCTSIRQDTGDVQFLIFQFWHYFTYNVKTAQQPTRQGRSQKFILGGYNFLLHDTTVLYISSLTTSAAISAQNNFQGLILGGYIYRYTPRRYAPATRGTVGECNNLNLNQI